MASSGKSGHPFLEPRLPLRGQLDLGVVEEVLDASEGDMTRQEFKDESDVLFQLRKFGVASPFRSGSVDFTMDLLSAHQLVEDSRDAWAKLPELVRERYADWPALEQAMRTGDLQDLLMKAAGAAGGSSPAVPAASASDSAPVTPSEGSRAS